jgi:hypothetical protein
MNNKKKIKCVKKIRYKSKINVDFYFLINKEYDK